MKSIELPFVKSLSQTLKNAKKPLIQVIIGPRQVGKTTGIQQFLKKISKKNQMYVTADGAISQSSDWLFEIWQQAKSEKKSYLVIDEIQKVEHWSEMIKKLWDEQHRHDSFLQLILLGSSSLSLQKGLSESLAGRFWLHRVFHWNPNESRAAYNVSLNDFMIYGGYPGSYLFLKNKKEWLHYMKHSIIEPVIGKDILSQAQVKSPALFKQCFDLACSYPAQEISYTKLLGQLQNKGNVELVKYYLELFESAFLLKQIHKFSTKKVLTRKSSPKILPLCPALFSITLDADLNAEDKGHAFEVVIGSLLNRLPGQLYYWRERNFEVDFIYQYGKKIFAIEVKSGRKKTSPGLMKFCEKFKTAIPKIITQDNYETILSDIEKIARST